MAAGDFPTLVLDSPRNIDVDLAQYKRRDDALRRPDIAAQCLQQSYSNFKVAIASMTRWLRRA
jgi:hypothetical protein